MEIKRRDFVRGCAAISVVGLRNIDRATEGEGLNDAEISSADSHIGKSIKASFGGGFSLKTHFQTDGMTWADIEHLGNRYAVASADLLDWKIIRSSLSDPDFASCSVSILPLSVV